jgi:hypothetical protein
MKGWKKVGALVIRTAVSTVLLCLLMYTFFACVDVDTFVSVAEIATKNPGETTLLFSPIVVMLCLSVMLCYLVITPPNCECCNAKKALTPVAKDEKKVVAKKAPAKKSVAKKVTKKK